MYGKYTPMSGFISSYTMLIFIENETRTVICASINCTTFGSKQTNFAYFNILILSSHYNHYVSMSASPPVLHSLRPLPVSENFHIS